MFSSIDYHTPIECDKSFSFDHLEENLTFYGNKTGNTIQIDSSPREISVVFFEAARQFLEHEFPGDKLVWRTRARKQGQTEELYSKLLFKEGSPEQRILSNVPFFPEIVPVRAQEGYIFVGLKTSVAVSVLNEDQEEMTMNPSPSTWCEMAEKLYEGGLSGWFLTITVTDNLTDCELVSMFAADEIELARAKLTIDLYTHELK